MKRFVWLNKFLMRLARMKARATQLGFYMSYWNTLMIMSIKGWQWWYLIAGGVVGCLYLYESHYGIKGSADVANAQSSHALDVTARLERIEKEQEVTNTALGEILRRIG
jgi:hypothetical protein